MPALAVTLLAVLILGFFLYTNKAYDNLGKQIFFSSFGSANILFAQGMNYFVQEAAYQPLTHLWSLGVEEQFYVAWPFIRLLAAKFSNRLLLLLITSLGLASLIASEFALSKNTSASYFLPHYRAFELLIGSFCAVAILNPRTYTTLSSSPIFTRQALSILGLAMVFVPSIYLTKESRFPGINALMPCLGTAILMLNPSTGWIK